jgi:hypothetical protein
MAIWSRDAAADAVRAFEPVPRQWIASLHDVGTRGAASVHDVFQRCNKCGAGGEVLLGGRHTAFGRAHWRYCWMRVVRKPAKPWRSIEYCQARNSSTESEYRLQASSSDSRPPRTAATTSALRRITQRTVPGAGRSAIDSGLPSGPITYFCHRTIGAGHRVLSYADTQARLHGVI